MFEKKYIRYWVILLLSLVCFIIGIKTNLAAGSVMALFLLITSNFKYDDKSLQLVSKILIVIITSITVYLTFFPNIQD